MLAFLMLVNSTMEKKESERERESFLTESFIFILDINDIKPNILL